MATLLYAIVDPAAGAISWVNAGHMPPLLVGEDGSPSFLDGSRSVPLGVLPFPIFEEAAAPMSAGSSVVLYTDGLIERPGTVIDDGITRARPMPSTASVPTRRPSATTSSRRSCPAAAAADDVALLALRNVPMTARIVSEFEPIPESLSSMRGLLRRWLRWAGADDQETAEIVTACGEAATNAIEHAGAAGDVPFEVAALPGRPPGGPERERPRRLALAARGRSRPRAVAHARADGQRGGVAGSGWN